jgi:K+-transporting ATPase ATPase C chain
MFAVLAEQLKIAFKLVVMFTLLTGIIYPLIVTGLGQGLFPWRANGSIIVHHGKAVGSELIGQNFSGPEYFWGRPSATTRFPYDAENSSGSNLALSNPAQINAVKARLAVLKTSGIDQGQSIPMDLVTASASGLDPEISPASAYYQVSRIAKARHLSDKRLTDLIGQAIRGRSFKLLGEPRLNVLQLNLTLDQFNLSQEPR